MKHRFPLLVSSLVLALAAALPLSRGQDAPPPATSGGGDDQAPPPPHRRGHGLSPAELKEKLKLTDDQFTKISGILGKQREAMMALHEDDSLSDEDKRAKMMELMKGVHDQIKALLTPDQLKIFETLRPGRGAPPPPPPPSEQ
jgi:Spy/CpxP family protein refolding chaperone